MIAAEEPAIVPLYERTAAGHALASTLLSIGGDGREVVVANQHSIRLLPI